MDLQHLLRIDLSHTPLADMIGRVPVPAGRVALPSAYAGDILKFQGSGLGSCCNHYQRSSLNDSLS
jgi:hypothetical protein